MIPSTKKIYLCSPDRKPQIVLNGVIVSTVDFHHVIKGYSELSFTVDRYININGRYVQSNGYDDLKAYMYLYLEDIGFFQMQEPIVENNGNYETKNIEAYSAEKEFEDKDWKGLKINTGEPDSVEYFYPDNIDDLGFAKRYVVMYDENDTRFSFLHLVLEKVPYWKIGYVDPPLKVMQIPTLDINNENLYAVMTNEVAPRLQCLFLFDFKNFEINAYHKNHIDTDQRKFDTGIFIGFRNLANEININVDNDSIFTRFTVAGADDLNIRHCNYGSDQIYNIDYFLGEPWMSEDLAKKIRNLNQFKIDHLNDYIDIIKQTSVISNKISELKYTVPSDELYWKNWNNMNEDGLKENLKYYQSLLESFQIAVDERPDEEKYTDYGTDQQKYNPVLKADIDEPYETIDGCKNNHRYIVWKVNGNDVVLVDAEETVNDTIVERVINNDIILTDFDKLLSSYENSKFGNISLNNRQTITWNEAILARYEDALNDWQEYDQDITLPVDGETSTFWSRYNVLYYNKGSNTLYVTITYSPILQVTNGNPVFLGHTVVEKYLIALISKCSANGYIDTDKLLELDAEGLDNTWDTSCTHISKLIAGASQGQGSQYISSINDVLHYWENNNDVKGTINTILHPLNLTIDDLGFDYESLNYDKYDIIQDVKYAIGVDTYNVIITTPQQMEKCGYSSEPSTIFLYDKEMIYIDNVDHQYYLDLLYANIGKYSGYYTYKEIIEYIIPFITLALKNYDTVQNGEEAEDPFEDFNMNDPLENWDLYGLEELEGVKKNYEDDLLNQLKRYSKSWNEMTEKERQDNKLNYISEEEYEASYQRQEYVHLKSCLGNEDGSEEGTIYHRLKELKEQIDTNQDQLDSLNLTIGEYNNIMKYDITNVDTYTNGDYEEVAYTHLPEGVTYGRKLFLLTQEEIDLVTILLHDTDYTNSNILTTQFDDTYALIDKEKALLDDAIEKLSEVSQPQFTFSVSLDNFLRLAQYQQWQDDFQLLKFIRLGIRDDYSVKLRVIGCRWNPCEVTPDLQLEFSNMISSKSGRSDLVQLLDLGNNAGSKNSIQIGNGTSKADQDFIASLVQLLAKNSVFTRTVSGIASNTQGEVNASAVENIVGNYLDTIHIDASTINVGNITGDEGQFERLFSKYLQSDLIYAKLLNADQANIRALKTEMIQIGEEDGDFTRITKDYIETHKISGDQITVTDAMVSNVLTVGEEGLTKLTNDTITTENIVGKLATINEIQAETLSAKIVTSDSIITGLINAQEGQFDDLTADNAFIQYLNANLITAGEIDVDDLRVKMATIDVADITQLSADSAFIKGLQSISATSATSVIDDAYIYNAVANKITVGELKAGDIILGSNDDDDGGMKIISKNGAMVMNGKVLQFGKTDEQTGEFVANIQLGYATDEKPSLIIRDEDGAVLFTSQGIIGDNGQPIQKGISAEAIANELIVNNMIQKGTIDADRLSFKVMEEGSKVTIEQIYLGDKQFGAEWTEFTQGTNESLDELRENIENSQAFSLYIETPHGTNISGGNIVLNARLFRNNEDVTSEYDDSCFTWTRTSRDNDGDIYWNANHTNGAKAIIITASDVRINADFQCKFEYENITVTSN